MRKQSNYSAPSYPPLGLNSNVSFGTPSTIPSYQLMSQSIGESNSQYGMPTSQGKIINDFLSLMIYNLIEYSS